MDSLASREVDDDLDQLANDDSRAYWRGLTDGVLRLQHCSDCGTARFFPASVCPVCWSTEYDWRTTTGAGQVHSMTRVHVPQSERFRPDVPYDVLLVELDAGPRVIGHAASRDHALRVGSRVVLAAPGADVARLRPPHFAETVTP